MSMLQGLVNYLAEARERATNGWMSIDTDHAYIHKGKRFSAFHKATITAGSTLEFSIVTPANKYIHYRPMRIKPSADKVDIQIYEGAVVNVAGTQLVYANRNRNDSTAATTVLRHGTTFSNGGTLISGASDWLPGSAGVGTIREGEVSNGAYDEIVFKPNTAYRIVVTNGSSGSNVIGFIFNHYEEDGY